MLPDPDRNGDTDSKPPVTTEEQATLIIDPAELTLASDMTFQLNVGLQDQKGQIQSVESKERLEFRSSDPAIATIDGNGNVHVAKEAVTGNKAIITVSYDNQSAQTELIVKNSLEHTVTAGTGSIAVVTNPQALDVVVNKQRSLPVDFVPPNMVEPDVPFNFSGKSEKKLMQEVAARALEALFAAAKKDDITLYAVSGYRSYGTQKSIYNHNVATQGEEHASRFSARPGHSEHQTGLTMDVTGTDPKCLLEQCFEHNAEGKWIAENAARYGFILRYPKDKEDITGYAFEPWHLRYLGEELALEIDRLNTTLEEYFSEAIPVSTD